MRFPAPLSVFSPVGAYAHANSVRLLQTKLIIYLVIVAALHSLQAYFSLAKIILYS